MNIFVCGLGLIGGSFAKAIRANTKHTVYGFDADSAVMQAALAEGNIDFAATEKDLVHCDLVLVALYPAATISFVQKNIAFFRKNAILIDTCGIKTEVCTALAEAVRGTTVRFIGGHPMAGIERSGYAHAFAELFCGASMILCTEFCTDSAAVQTVSELCKAIGFGRITLSTCTHHDEVIAFTSQLAHVVSSAYVHGRLATEHSGFSAGSYKDMTRVARLNADMWTELFFQNAANLSAATEELIANLEKFKTALDTNDREGMHALLADGNARKKESDKL